MAITYSRESGSLFPDSILSMNDKKDIDDSVKDLVMQIYSLIENNKINKAKALRNDHPELDDYEVNAADFNLLTEEIQNIGIYTKRLSGTVVLKDEPTLDYETGSSWIRPLD